MEIYYREGHKPVSQSEQRFILFANGLPLFSSLNLFFSVGLRYGRAVTPLYFALIAWFGIFYKNLLQSFSSPLPGPGIW